MSDSASQLEQLQRENEKLKRELKEARDQLKNDGTSDDTVQELDNPLAGSTDSLTIVVFGASGDLAKKKTFPALLALHEYGLLPPNTSIVGYARTKMEEKEFIEKISKSLKGDEKKREEFLKMLHYFSGQYDSSENQKKLDELIGKWEEKSSSKKGNRIFYLAIPPSVFEGTAKAIKESAMSKTGWNRVIVEKPFGRDFDSSEKLSQALAKLFTEDQIYRIDHYLGKEMVQNLLALRFANSVFEPLWNRIHIKVVQIVFKENFGTQGRGGYFDEFGIIRDVMQNHLLQVLSLFAMEPPVSLDASDVRDEKTKLLRCIPPIKADEVVIGQYGPAPDGREPGYLDDEGVPKDSITPTFATAVLHVNNGRWNGTPFIIKCGKALNEKKAEVRIQFHESGVNLYPNAPLNELVLRLSDEAIYLKLSIKKPGLSDDLEDTELDLTYKSRHHVRLPDAYERLIFDVIRGDHNLFVRSDELSAAWRIFTPLLHELDEKKIKPVVYKFGSRGPDESDELVKRFGYVRNETYNWPASKI